MLKFPEAQTIARQLKETMQRITRICNGVLQDILWHAKAHPKRKMSKMFDSEISTLFHTLKNLFSEMTEKGGSRYRKRFIRQPRRLNQKKWLIWEVLCLSVNR